jgi:hypothetical protein
MLTQSHVVSGSFGLFQMVPPDDQVDAQPLVVSGETINGVSRNVVHVATGHVITAQTRTGSDLRIDAPKNFRPAEPSIGHARIVRGTHDKAGVFAANTILPAKDHPAMRPADR